MNDSNKFDSNSKRTFDCFIKEYNFNELQSDQFHTYLSMLLTSRKQFNLTALATIDDIINFHFKDSLELCKAVNLKEVATIADVGSGGGFPGIPIKIAYPHLRIYLIEVNLKKLDFLNKVTRELNLENCEFSSLDWRTFLRTTSYPIDYFIARASLNPEELLRVFQPSSFYKGSILVYWASRHWKMLPREEPYFLRDYSYTIQDKQRKLIFFVANRLPH